MAIGYLHSLLNISTRSKPNRNDFPPPRNSGLGPFRVNGLWVGGLGYGTGEIAAFFFLGILDQTPHACLMTLPSARRHRTGRARDGALAPNWPHLPRLNRANGKTEIGFGVMGVFTGI